MAGCTWTSHALMGRAGNNPMCYHRALEMDRKGLRERLVKMKDAPGHSFDNGEWEIVVETAVPRVLDPHRGPWLNLAASRRRCASAAAAANLFA